MKTAHLLPGALALCALPTAAQQRADLILTDDGFLCSPLTQTNQLLLGRDLDGDGVYHTANEMSALYANNQVEGRIQTADFRSENGISVVYWIDQDYGCAWFDCSRGAVLRGADSNGDGTLTGSEVVVWRDWGNLNGPADAFSLEATPDGSVWFATNAGGTHKPGAYGPSDPATCPTCSTGGETFPCTGNTLEGVFRLRDLNADGDANDVGEMVTMVDGLLANVTVETDAGPMTVDPDDWSRMCASGNGVVVYNDGNDEAAIRFVDSNDDGDVKDAGESRLFLNASGKNVALPMNADWGTTAGATLRNLRVVSAAPCGSGSTGFGRLNHWTSRMEGADEAYYFACDSSNTSAFKQNQFCEYINGLIFRAVDGNGDGDIQDTGEVSVFYDGSFSSACVAQLTKVLGLDANADGVYVADLAGNPVVHVLSDNSADGDACDVGEQSFGAYDTSLAGLGITPFVNDLAVAPQGSFQHGFSVTGTACSFFGLIPEIGAEGVPQIGTTTFKVKVFNTKPGIPAILYLGASTTTWFGFGLPLDLSLFGFSGCTLYQDLALSFTVLTNPQGVGSKTFSITSTPSLVGLTAPFQWLVIDIFTVGSPIGLSALGTATVQP